jgi:hypothetical protein
MPIDSSKFVVCKISSVKVEGQTRMKKGFSKNWTLCLYQKKDFSAIKNYKFFHYKSVIFSSILGIVLWMFASVKRQTQHALNIPS